MAGVACQLVGNVWAYGTQLVRKSTWPKVNSFTRVTVKFRVNVAGGSQLIHGKLIRFKLELVLGLGFE